jgi:hypothetical protein
VLVGVELADDRGRCLHERGPAFVDTGLQPRTPDASVRARNRPLWTECCCSAEVGLTTGRGAARFAGRGFAVGHCIRVRAVSRSGMAGRGRTSLACARHGSLRLWIPPPRLRRGVREERRAQVQ